MKHEIVIYHPQKGWQSTPAMPEADLILGFVHDEVADSLDLQAICSEVYPKADLLLVGSGGQIVNAQIYDEECCFVAIQCDTSKLSVQQQICSGFEYSYAAGMTLAQSMMGENLKHIMLFADAQHVNASLLIKGMYEVLPQEVGVSGGLASDGGSFIKSRVGLNGPLQEKKVVAIGFYGESLKVYCAAESGWHEFGPLRTVTRSQANVLYEVDGEPFIDLYKRYIDIEDDDDNLTTRALYHPIAVMDARSGEPAVRAVFGIDEAKQSMTLAADIPMGCQIKLTHGNYKEILSGAENAASAMSAQIDKKRALVLVVSCIARRKLLGIRSEDELEAMKELLPDTDCIGFYSHGEIAYSNKAQVCDLHNQTMTMTAIVEGQNDA